MNKKKTKTSTSSSNTKKKTAYVSFSFAELQLLRDRASFECAFAYSLLKKRASFKTGIVKGFNGHKLTYEELAGDLSRPASQGRAAIAINRQQARDIVERLSVIGLVADINTANNELTLRLPISPIEYEKEVGTDRQEVVIAGKSTSPKKFKQATSANDANSHSGFHDMEDTSSVLSFSSTNSTKSLSNDSGEGFPSPAVASNVHPQPILEEANPEKSEIQKLADSFEQLLEQADFELTDLPLSRKFFRRWADAGFTTEQVVGAVETVVIANVLFPVDRLLPLEVDKLLCPSGRKKSTGRGRVSL